LLPLCFSWSAEKGDDSQRGMDRGARRLGAHG
jgi:hypothetical protein